MGQRSIRKSTPRGRNGRWRVLAGGLVSFLVHGAVVLMLSPDYDEVSDVAVSLEVVEGDFAQPLAPEAAGPRKPEPTKESAPETPLPAAPEEAGTITDEAAEPVSATANDTDSGTDSGPKGSDGSDSSTASGEDSETGVAEETDTTTADSDSDTQPDKGSDAGAGAVDTEPRVATSEGGTDSGGGVGGQADTSSDTGPKGICLHDVFAYGKKDPSWVAWLSMKAFAKTRYEQGLAAILKSFYLYSEMVSATEIDPLTELDDLLISADSFDDFSSYQVVTTYNVGQPVLEARLKRNLGSSAGFSMNKTGLGIAGVAKEGYRWDLVGSGRVMVAQDAKKGQFNPRWPKSVSCMMPRPPLKGSPAGRFNDLTRTTLGPDEDGHWPVMMMATRDAGAVGLAGHAALANGFQYAIIKGYFSNPIRVEGEVRFSGGGAMAKRLEAHVRYLLSQGDKLKYFGLGGLADKVTYKIADNTMTFSVPLTEAQIMVGLMLVKSYSRMINQHLSKQHMSR